MKYILFEKMTMLKLTLIFTCLWLQISFTKHVDCVKIMRTFNHTTHAIQTSQITKNINDPIVYTSTEEKLFNYLFKDYNPNIIPRENSNESLKLYIGLAMVQLINIYDKEQVMKTNVWIHMWWNDPFLQWSHIEEYSHIISIRVPYDKVWTPDIILFNNAHGKYDFSYKCNVVLYQQGGLLWIPPSIYKSTCHLDMTYFPLDQQTCEMVFGSWVYNSNELVLDYFENMRNVDLNDYVPSGTWDIIEVPASIEYFNETHTNRTKVQMVYRIKIRRKSLFYLVNIIIPTFLISFLSVCVFYLPTDDGEKITLSLSILFAIVVFFLLISKIIPPTSIVVPLISKYLLFTFIMNILSVLNTCIVIGFYFKELKLDLTHPWFRFIFLKFLPTILFIKRQKTIQKIYPKKMNDNNETIAEEQSAQLIQTPFKLNEYESPSRFNNPNYLPENQTTQYLSLKKRCIPEHEITFNSPLLRTNTLNRYKYDSSNSNYDATAILKNTNNSLYSRINPNKTSYEHMLSRKANSQHDLILMQDIGKKKVVAKTVKQAASKKSETQHRGNLSTPFSFENNEIIIENYLKEKLNERHNKKLNRVVGTALPRESLYDIEKLKRSPEIRKRFFISNESMNHDNNLIQANPNQTQPKSLIKPNISHKNNNNSNRFSKSSISKENDNYVHANNNLSDNVRKMSHTNTNSNRNSKKKRIITFETFKMSDKFVDLYNSVDYIKNIYKTKAELDEIKEDWKYIASLFDRLMLIIFFLVTFIGTYNSLLNAPHLFESIDEQNVIKSNSHRLGKP